MYKMESLQATLPYCTKDHTRLNPMIVDADMLAIRASRLRVATALAKKAGQAMLEATALDVTYKGRHDL